MDIDTFLDQQITVEQALIGCALIGPTDVRELCGWLKPEAFHDGQLGQFWREFMTGEQPIYLAVRMKLLPVSGWMETAISFTYAPIYAKAIAEAAQLRDMNSAVAMLAVATGTGNHAAAMQLVQDLAKRQPPTAPSLRTAIDVGAAFLVSLDAEYNDILTHIPPLDNAIGGLETGNLSVLAARPSMGKSALAWQIARTVAMAGRRVVFASLEMSENELWYRAACGALGISRRDVRTKRISADQREQIEQMCSDLMYQAGPNLIIEDTSLLTTSDLWQIVTLARPALVVADHISLLGDKAEDGNENRRLGAITWKLKQVAKEFDCHVLAVAQLNRQADQRSGGEKRPQLTDLRDSGEIEQNADIVLMLYREGYYHPEKELNNNSATELWIRKNRNGPSNACVNLTFQKNRQWFDIPNR